MNTENFLEVGKITYYCRYHVLWCVKYRRKVLTGEIKERTEQIIKDIKFDSGITVDEISIYPEYVHLIITISPQNEVHKVIKQIKRETASILRTGFKELTTKLPTLWDNAYLATTEPELRETIVDEYLSKQKKSQRG